MKKHYAVNITTYATVLVLNAESEEDAINQSITVDLGVCAMDDARVYKEIELDDTVEIERYKRHLDAVVDCE